jgi:short-subunit dehydrogenase
MQRILILGATSAIASDVARLYAARGASLYLVGRDPSKLSRLVAELAPQVAGHAEADFTQTESAAARIDAAIDRLGGLDVAVIAHGLLGDQQATERDYRQAEAVLQANFLSVVSLLIPLANHFETRSTGGHLAVLSSVAGERGRPRNYTYGSAKAALNAYLQGLRTRLWKTGVQVHTIKLGPVDTPMTADHGKNILFATSPRAAKDIVAAIDRGQSEAYVPWYWRPIMEVIRRIPEPLVQKLPFLSGR